MSKKNVMKRVLSVLLSLVVVSISAVGVKAGEPVKWVSNQNYINELGISVSYNIGDIVEPGTLMPSQSAKTGKYCFKTNPELMADFLANPYGELTEEYLPKLTSLLLVPQGYYLSSGSAAPAAESGYTAWELKMIVNSNSDVIFFFVPYKPSNNPKPDYVGSDAAYYAPLETAIDIAVANGSKDVIEWSAGDALPASVVKKLVENPGVTVHFTYSYDGVDYDLMLNAANLSLIYDERIEWYGPLCLAACNGQYFQKGYVVKEGDTLSFIAAKLGTTVEAIIERNPDIKDRDLIYVGQIIY